MSDLRSILLHVDAAARVSVRLGLAQVLATRHAAALDALYAVTPAVLAQPFAMAEGEVATVQLLQKLEDELRQIARQRIVESGGKPTPSWSDTGQDLPVPAFTARALFADLLVLGQHDAAQPQAAGTPPDFVESVLLATGKPALVVPCYGKFDEIGKSVLLAWKGTRESAHALGNALPLLRDARELHVVGAEPADEARLAAYLSRHGVQAALRHHPPIADHDGELLLSLAAETGADMIVMGCYGHSRARELVLGGVSRTILGSMTVPVLMAH
jgi:nucleotide-binding universal stress UspA family protein